MKVLHISTHFNVGGISNYILTLSGKLKSGGVEVIVASSGGDLEEELARLGVRHIRLGIDTKFEFSPKVFASAFRLAGILRDEGIDIIHAHTRVSQVAALIASRMTGVRFVTTCHGYFKKRLRGIVDSWGDSVIAISDAVSKHLTGDLNVKPARVELVYSGVDASRFPGSDDAALVKDTKRELGLEDAQVVGTIGRLSSVKGQKFMIEAMPAVLAERPDAQAVLLGSGDEEDALKNLAHSLGVAGSVHFYRSCADTRRFLSVMDVFVFPSIKEGLGIALLEAMASARACVASRVGGIEDIIRDGANGILVEARDPKAIADAVIRLLSDDSLRSGMGKNARDLVKEKFTLDTMADKIVKVYEKALARGRSKR